jgi:hypothetical protein
MSRIRTIKPEFPQSETVGKLSRDARLLFIQLWTIADDDGRARAASRMLASLLYPYDDDARDLIDDWLEELEVKECIRIYEVEGSTYLEIVNWLKHQKIDRPSKSKIPPFVEGSRSLANAREPSATDLVPSTKDLVPSTDSRAVANATRTECEQLFDEFWRKKPDRKGANPKTLALKRFLTAVATGRKYDIDRETAAAIIAGAERWCVAERENAKIGTEFVAQAATWLSQQRWKDYPVQAPPKGPPPGKPGSDELREKYRKILANEQQAAGIRLEQGAPVDAGGLRLRETERGLVRGEAQQRGAQSLGSVLSRSGLDAANLSSHAQRAECEVDSALPMAGMADHRQEHS